MELRKKQLSELQVYREGMDSQVTMILQQLQWDSNHLLQDSSMVKCKYDKNHSIPANKKETHEEQCFLIQNCYSKEDIFLPDPADINTPTLVNLSKTEIQQIIENVAKDDYSFKRVLQVLSGQEKLGSVSPAPLTLDRLQVTYSADERRAIHEAVVKAAPFCHDLADLALLSQHGVDQKNPEQKSRVEILSELRDMRRRRTKYRGAAKTRNYSDVLRGLISTQMEMYTEVKEEQARQIKIEQDNIRAIKSHSSDRYVKKQPNQNNDDHGKGQSSHKHKRNKSNDREDTKHSSRSKRRRRYSSDDEKSSYSRKSYDKKQAERYKYREAHESRNYTEDHKRHRSDQIINSKDMARMYVKTEDDLKHKHSFYKHASREYKHESRRYYDSKPSEVSKNEKRTYYDYKK